MTCKRLPGCIISILLSAILFLPVLAFAAPPEAPTAEYHLVQGQIFLEAGDYTKAISCFNEAIRIQPKLINAYLYRAFAYHNSKSLDLAIADLSKAIELNPLSSNAYSNRGVCYRLQGHYELALSDFSLVIKLTPSEPLPYINRANLYGIQKEYQLSLQDSESALKLSPNSGMARFNLAQALELTGYKAAAAKQYELAFQYLAPEYVAERKKAEARIDGDWDTLTFWM